MDKYDIEKVNLANLILRRIKEKPKLDEYVSVSLDGADLAKLPLGNLLYYLEEYYNRATTAKSVLNFITEDIGLNKRHCILILAIQDDTVYQLTTSIIADETEGYYVARAKTRKEALDLLSFFELANLSCGIIVSGEERWGNLRSHPKVVATLYSKGLKDTLMESLIKIFERGI